MIYGCGKPVRKRSRPQRRDTLMMIKYDSRNKKPTVFNILFLTIVATAMVAVLLHMKNENIILYSVINVVYLLSVIILLVRAFFHQLEYNPYSYNIVIYFGFALFLIVNLIAEGIVTWRVVLAPENYDVTVHLSWIVMSGKVYILLSFPFVFVFGAMLCVSNIALIRHEGRSFKNLLGILLSVFMIAFIIWLFVSDFSYSGSYDEVIRHDMFINLIAAIFLYLESMLVGAIAASLIAAFIEPPYDRDYMIILGCGMRSDGTPTPLLKGRIERALTFYEKQWDVTGKKLKFVCSGGQGSDEPIPESTCMKRYLMERGISEHRIIEEDKSTDTRENMSFSRIKIWAEDRNAKIAFSTTNYHVFRSGIWARRAKMRALGVGAKTKWYFWPNAWVREFIGLMTEHRGKQILVLGGMVLFYLIALYLYRFVFVI